MVFKTLIARWDEGECLNITETFLNKREIYWENPQGAGGNKVMKFNDFVMKHNPSYGGNFIYH